MSPPLHFPDPRTAPANEPLGYGGVLAPDNLLQAYKMGIFPWSSRPVTWWSPDPRASLPLDGLKISRSLKKTLNKKPFSYTLDQAFDAVMEGCAEPAPQRESTWIDSNFLQAYSWMHRLGHAHSVEVWDKEGSLAGGLYGVSIGGLFAGESIFNRVPDAGKAALIYLVSHLNQRGFGLLDVQMLTPLTEAMGAILIPREKYLIALADALHLKTTF